MKVFKNIFKKIIYNFKHSSEILILTDNDILIQSNNLTILNFKISIKQLMNSKIILHVNNSGDITCLKNRIGGGLMEAKMFKRVCKCLDKILETFVNYEEHEILILTDEDVINPELKVGKKLGIKDFNKSKEELTKYKAILHITNDGNVNWIRKIWRLS